ncbi:MAG: potassium-transporting ATPase subunit KdpA [Methanothrix sp.]|jgi:K+-transporting ATPase ATPase A chain|uniref:potassium-transporting ATPase subunit KdpA n=2 Tax=Methanothrix sp. TaxID=90426 RepID=UPI003BB4F563
MLTELAHVALLLGSLLILAAPIGRHIARVFSGERTLLSPLIRPIERGIYRIADIDENREMHWKTYASSLLVFNILGIAAVFLLQELQGLLPFNPDGLGPVRWDTALNTAVSFTTNTNWQSYSGEQTLTYLTQMLGLTVQNFLSAAVGLAAAMAVIRGFTRKNADEIGNFWVDLTRSVLYLLLPLAIVWALIFASQGVVQTLGPYVISHGLEGTEQVIALGPAASQDAIKFLGTNGGGFFNANSAHPFENPTPLTDFLQVLGMLLIPASLPFAFGSLIKNHPQGKAIFASMLVLYIMGLGVGLWAETSGNPLLEKLGVAGGINMEGKEMRFGVVPSLLFAQSTTVTSCGGVDSMHDSLMPLTGLVLLFNMAIGEVIFGGVGVGLIGIFFYAIMTMFLAGLMIGRTPELFGKKLEPFEMIMAVVGLLAPSVTLLIFAAVAIVLPQGLSSLNNAGPHGLSEILYAFASACGNNGSALAGLNANTVFYNMATALGMLVGRFATILPALALAGSLAQKRIVPASSATLPAASPLFVIMLMGTVLIVGALTFFPVFVLGPILEHLLMQAGTTF